MTTDFLKSISWLRTVFVIVLALVLIPDVYSQERTISGTVTDAETGETLPGVSVIILGTTNGTVTDIDGNYKVTATEGSTLTFSFIGFANQQVKVSGKTIVDVALEIDIKALDEVVIVDYGYGSVKKTDFTGSVATLSGSDLKKIPMASTAQALTGRLPGVNVLTTDGSPGAEIVIRVRGGNSITQDNSPLYVVDGFIVNSINDIPPSDIESITVLKDAAATAIYGAQASNGVIVIRTKTPVAGKTTVSYNGFVQGLFLPDDRRHNVLSPYEYVLANYEYAKLNSSTDVKNFEKYFGTYEDLELYKNKPGTDWQDELFGSTRISQYHNLSVSGGSEMTKMNLSVTTNNDEGLLSNNAYERNVINFKLSHKISDKIMFDAGARITNTIKNGAGTSGNAQLSIKDAIQTRPVNGIADELDIDLTNSSGDDQYQSFLLSLVNPTELLKQDWRKRTTNSYVLNAGLTWEVIDNLNIKTTINGQHDFDENLRYYGPLTSESFNNGGNLPIGERTDTQNTSMRWMNTASYTVPNLNNQSLNILIGQEIYSSGGQRHFVRSEDFRETITPQDLFANMTFGRTDRHETEDYTQQNRFSTFGRLDYQYAGKYLATATFRSDASSKFAKENRLGIFPAVALGWKISEEGFLSGAAAIDVLKLRISYGQTGNDGISANATKFLLTGSTNRGPGFNNVDNAYYTPESRVLFNPFLVWETTINRNVGLDFTLFRSKIEGTVDFYYNTSKDLLLQKAIPQNSGFQYQWENIGSTSSKGVDLGINSFIIDKNDLSVSLNFNLGVNRVQLEDLGGPTERFDQSNWASTDLKDRDDFYAKVGGKIGNIYGYVTDGYYTTDDFSSYDEATGKYILKEGVANSGATVGRADVRPGFLKLKDLNGDSLITSEDRKIIGNTLPKAQGGFGLNARYKGFDVALFFNWSLGNDVYNAEKIQFSQFRRTTYGNMLNEMNSDHRFSYIDVDGTYGAPGEVVTDLTQLAEMNAGKDIWSHYSYGVAGAVIHSWAVEDGSFIRLNQASIGYSLPTKLISKLKLSQFRVYVTGNNLHLWTKYSGFDPEVSTSRSSTFQQLTPGVDYSSFPRSRSFTAGVNLTF